MHSADKLADFDGVRVRRIDIIEPDGTPRLLVSDGSDFPGEYFHGREIPRSSRNDSAGMLFINDEGTEDGGLIYRGAKQNGQPSNFSHLSSDEYDPVVVGTALSNGEKTAGISLNDMPAEPITPALADEAASSKCRTALKEPRLGRRFKRNTLPEATCLAAAARRWLALSLKDPRGRRRLQLSRDSNGNPSVELLDNRAAFATNYPCANSLENSR